MHKVVKAGEFKGKAYFLTVTGILRDIPRNSHLSFDYLFSINTVTNHLPNYLDSKGWMSVYTYVLLAKGYTSENFEVQERDFIQRFYGWKGRTTVPTFSAIVNRSPSRVAGKSTVFNECNAPPICLCLRLSDCSRSRIDRCMSECL